MTPIHETLVHQKRVVRLQPPHRLDAQGGAILQQQIAAIEPGQGIWLVDMAHVEFIDGAGRLALVEALNLAQRSHCRLLICHLRPAINLIFEITRLDQIFEIVDSSTDLTGINGSTTDGLPQVA